MGFCIEKRWSLRCNACGIYFRYLKEVVLLKDVSELTKMASSSGWTSVDAKALCGVCSVRV